MKKHKRYLSVAVVVGLLVALPIVAFGVISGSDHDFSSAGWNSSGAICEPCHTPHNAMTTVANAPLWNHTLTTPTFSAYTGPATLAAPVRQPSGVSLLCRSCHDGTVALDS